MEWPLVRIGAAASISLDADYAVASSPKKRAALPKYRYAVRIAAVLVAVLGDILLIGAAALTAAFVRFESLSDANTIDLLLVIVPAFLLATVTLKVYRLNTLRSFFDSVGRTLLALAIAAGLAFTIAFALKVGATYSRLETGITFGTAAVYLAMSHVLYAACLERLSGAIDPRVLILGPAVGAIDISPNVERSIPLERPNPTDPVLLERIYRQIRHADRIILAFDDPGERAEWAQFVRLIGIDGELIGYHGSGREPLGRNANISCGTPRIKLRRKGCQTSLRSCNQRADFVSHRASTSFAHAFNQTGLPWSCDLCPTSRWSK